MARIEHIAFWVENMDVMVAFYANYFGVHVGDLYENPTKGFRSRFLGFESGCRLEMMTTTSLALERSAPGTQRHGLTHIAISVGSIQAVDAVTVRLKSDGLVVLDGPRRTGDGYYESIVLDPEGNRVEVTI